jgi:hypothetical protein
VIRKSYVALRNLVTSLPTPNSTFGAKLLWKKAQKNLKKKNPNPDPNPNIIGQVESETESKKNGLDPHDW